MSRKKEKSWFLYLISDGGNNFKIGIAVDPLKRVKILNSGNPTKLGLITTFSVGNQKEAIKAEQYIHKELGSGKKRNGEWFNLSSIDIRALIILCIEHLKYKPITEKIIETVMFKKRLLTDDELYEEAEKTVRLYGRASASLLQRRLSIGYARAARIVDMLEAKGIVGPFNGSVAREILN